MSDAARRDAAALECQHDFGDRTLGLIDVEAPQVEAEVHRGQTFCL